MDIYKDTYEPLYEDTSLQLKVLESSHNILYQVETFDETFSLFGVLLDFIDNYGGIY